jgi:hypothetical protein
VIKVLEGCLPLAAVLTAQDSPLVKLVWDCVERSSLLGLVGGARPHDPGAQSRSA